VGIEISTYYTWNSTACGWRIQQLLGDVVVVTPLLDRLVHHGHLLKFEGESWRLKEAAARVAKRTSSNYIPLVPPSGVEEFDPATGGGV
jgi:hypothetical protein